MTASSHQAVGLAAAGAVGDVVSWMFRAVSRGVVPVSRAVGPLVQFAGGGPVDSRTTSRVGRITGDASPARSASGHGPIPVTGRVRAGGPAPGQPWRSAS